MRSATPLRDDVALRSRQTTSSCGRALVDPRSVVLDPKEIFMKYFGSSDKESLRSILRTLFHASQTWI